MAEVVFETRGLTKVDVTGEVKVQALRSVDVKFYASEMTASETKFASRLDDHQ